MLAKSWGGRLPSRRSTEYRPPVLAPGPLRFSGECRGTEACGGFGMWPRGPERIRENPVEPVRSYQSPQTVLMDLKEVLVEQAGGAGVKRYAS